MENPRIESVAAQRPSRLSVNWKGGGSDTVDLSGWIATGGQHIGPLSEWALFAVAEIGDWGASVEWPGGDDWRIDAVHLKMLADEQKPFGTKDLTEWQSNLKISNREAADLVGIGLSTWNGYRAGAAIPTALGMLLRAIQRDPVLLQAHLKPRHPGRPAKADMQDA